MTGVVLIKQLPSWAVVGAGPMGGIRPILGPLSNRMCRLYKEEAEACKRTEDTTVQFVLASCHRELVVLAFYHCRTSSTSLLINPVSSGQLTEIHRRRRWRLRRQRRRNEFGKESNIGSAILQAATRRDNPRTREMLSGGGSFPPMADGRGWRQLSRRRSAPATLQGGGPIQKK
jgi:hypothetical protein